MGKYSKGFLQGFSLEYVMSVYVWLLQDFGYIHEIYNYLLITQDLNLIEREKITQERKQRFVTSSYFD